MRNYFRALCLCVFVVFLATSLSAETLDTLERTLRETDRQIAALEKEYGKEQQANAERIRKSHLKEAYASAERLQGINQRLNELHIKHDSQCKQWKGLYRTEADRLLGIAESEQQKGKKAEIGRLLIDLQARNTRFCPESAGTQPSSAWRSVKIESYDGPREMQEKTQLLRDLSREVSISLTKLDAQYQDALRERRTRERAQEFIQEGTLFNDSAGIRSPTFTSTTGSGAAAPVEVVDRPSSADSSAATSGNILDLEKELSPQQLETEYKKKRTELLSQQAELQNRIEEFSRTARSLIP